MIDERHLNGTTGESKSFSVTNNGNATSTARNLYYEQLQDQSDRDYVEVVRCRDCRHWHESVCFRGEQGQTLGQCDCTMSMRDTDFFCKAGEKERRCQD